MAYTILYVWEDLDAPESEQKFGDHFSEAANLTQAFTETEKYIRGSLGRQKHKFDEGRVVIHKMWDATEYAKLKGRFGKHQKVDDVVRPVVGHHVAADVHRIEADILIDRVNRELIKHGQPLPVAGISQNQHDAAVNVIQALNQGKRTIVAELCARFGKTIWSGVLITETRAPLTIVASYVLTSFASFRKDLSGFEQFRNLVIVDTADTGYQDIITDALSMGKQVVALLSMCTGTNRQKKIDYLFAQNCSRLILVDEADFGVHKSNQSQPLIRARGTNDAVVLMTGTNGDKAASAWNVDHYLSVTYPELILEKKSESVPVNRLERFQVDPDRHTLVVDVEFYQMNLSGILNIARASDPEAFMDNGVFLPSWSKFAANPIKAKGFLTRMLQAVFEGKHGTDELNVDLQTGRRSKEGQKVAMMFLPGSMTNDNLIEAADIASQALQGFVVVPISGAADVTNATAESTAKDAISRAQRAGQHVLMLSAGMAQRSFSIPEITELYLAYDAGDNGATIQKMSRALTPDRAGKVGRVISLSFDPNRDDKFDAMLIETAQNYQANKGINNLKQALADVLRTVDVFRCGTDGASKIQPDDYLAAALARNSVDRIVGKVAQVQTLSAEVIRAINQSNAEVFRAAMVEAAQRGKTRESIPRTRAAPQSQIDATAAELARAREVIVTIAQNLDIIRYQGGTSLDEAFAIVDTKPQSVRDGIGADFGLDYELIKALVQTGIINRDLLDLKFSV